MYRQNGFRDDFSVTGSKFKELLQRETGGSKKNRSIATIQVTKSEALMLEEVRGEL